MQTGTQSLRFSVSPHPAENFLNVSFDMLQEAETLFMIKDMNGREVVSRQVGRYPSGNQNVSIDISFLPSGVYTLSFFDSKAWGSKKIVVTK
jgi:hypothetical protein